MQTKHYHLIENDFCYYNLIGGQVIKLGSYTAYESSWLVGDVQHVFIYPYQLLSLFRPYNNNQFN